MDIIEKKLISFSNRFITFQAKIDVVFFLLMVLELYKKREEYMKKHCCEDMAYHANFKCDIHGNPFECPDEIIIFDEKR